jgi:hypothetical protein
MHDPAMVSYGINDCGSVIGRAAFGSGGHAAGTRLPTLWFKLQAE